ncbi:MAG: ribonuclease HI [Thermodesulfobacteriaceae bacterium]
MREHNLSLDQILSRIDYAYLKPYGNVREFLEFLERARSFPFRAVCVPPCLIKKAIEERLDKRIVGVLDFPFAYSTTLTKIAALEEMLSLGVEEVDIPLNIIWLKSQEIKPLKRELSLFRRIAEECILKGIIESPVLTDEEIELAVKLLAEAGFDYVKTSTGFSGKGTSLEEVKKIKEYARGRIKIKASGGIRTLDQVLDFLSAGADLIGTSYGFEIALEALKEMEEGLDYAEAYIDGACLGNPGPGGFAVIIKEGDEETVLVGSEPETTNNRMELKALICALSYFKKPKRIKVYTDSEYLLRGAVEWLPKWKAQGFKTSEGNPVKNRDLWEEIDRLMSIHKVTFEKVKAHSGVLLNEKADRLAKEQAKKWQKKPF